MINKNKTRKYVLYAIGEIILVVIGILIALQINNWNEDRKRLDEREILLSALKKDFSSTQITLRDKLIQLETLNSDMRVFLNLLRTDNQTVSLDSAQGLFRSFFTTIPFKPVLSSLNEAQSSGTFKLLNNDSLSRSIADFKSYYEDFQLLNTIAYENAFLGPGYEFRKSFGFIDDISGGDKNSTITKETFMAIVSTNEAKAYLEGWEVWSRNINFRFNGMNTSLNNILKAIDSMEKEIH